MWEVGTRGRQGVFFLFHFPLSSCSVENWSGEKPGPAPAQILEVQTAQDELHTGWELEQIFKLTENGARGQKESLEHQKNCYVCLKAVCDRAASPVGRSHTKAVHDLRPALSRLFDLRDHK